MTQKNNIGKILEDELYQQLDLGTYLIEVGVIEGKSVERKDKERKDKKKLKKRKTKRKDKKSSKDITNAELMFIHEFGAPNKNIPPRPALQMTIDYANENLVDDIIIKCIDNIYDKNWTEKDIEDELNRLCITIENYAKEIIYSNDGRLIRNADSTIEQKGFNHPLFKTGDLVKSITSRLTKIK